MASERREWEYARGPSVGSEVPITSEPRAEERPGVPARTDGGGGADDRGSPVTVVGACTAAAVVIFCAVIALAFQH